LAEFIDGFILIMDLKSLAILGSIFGFGILEYLFPFFKYNKSFDNLIFTNVYLGLINILANNASTVTLLNWVWQQNSWMGLFQGIQPTWLSLFLCILILDLYMYLWHRLMHSIAIGWRFHQVHHSDDSMNTSTVYRFHLVEVVISNLPKILLIWIFGIKTGDLFTYEVLFSIELVFHHSNWALPKKIDKYLSLFIVTPNYHRSHHSQIREEQNTNLASMLSIWDILFKTRSYPLKPENIKLGLSKSNHKFNVIDLMVLPFS
jgi:sterol desaturase/sphingolipid hydroxylase (fatty acid hydroxylase superfamily)